MSTFKNNSMGISWEPFSHPSFESIGIRGQHAFIIYTDEAGINHILEHGDPYYSYDDPSLPYDGSSKNYLRYRVGILDDTTPYPHPEGTREQINSDGIIFKSSASFPDWKASDTYFSLDIPIENQRLVWEEMKEHAKAIKDSRTPYEFGLQGPVSNSVVASILADIGFSLEEITGVSIPPSLSMADAASIGTAIAFGQVSMNDLGYGGISNTVSHVQSGNISGLTHAQIRGSNESTDSDTTPQDQPPSTATESSNTQTQEPITTSNASTNSDTAPQDQPPSTATESSNTQTQEPITSSNASTNSDTAPQDQSPSTATESSNTQTQEPITSSLEEQANPTITAPKAFKKKFADRIINFNPSTDNLAIDLNSFDLKETASFKTAKNKKSIRKNLSKKEFDFLYDQKKGGLYYNQNGAEKGLGEGGIIAILKGSPDISSENISFI